MNGSLKPTEVWSHFEKICKIPRPSKKEEKILAHLIQFAENHGLSWKKDSTGNILITKPASPGYENRKVLVLQSHVDMVGEKLGEVDHDFEKDPIQPVLDNENEWVTAQGTTLGADDGIGMAAQLAILESETIQHGPLECLFTVDEESGMTGAFGLQPGFFTGKILINLDSEDEGELFIGCAGGIDTMARFSPSFEEIPGHYMAFRITLNGLKGGHSGDEIHKGLGNSVKLLNRFFWEESRQYDLRLCSFEGGNMRNAIPREGQALLVVPRDRREDLIKHLEEYEKTVRAEYRVTEPNLKLMVEPVSKPPRMFTRTFQDNLVKALYACPHGVYAWSQDIPGLVESSTNLASIKQNGNGNILVTTSQRSSVDSARKDLSQKIRCAFELAGGQVEHTGGYPGWKPDPDSEIVRITTQGYIDLFGKKPVVRAIHAGLECGLFLQKYPDLDMISFGPTIKGAHTPDERINIHTVEKFWNLLLELMKRIPEQTG